MLSFFWGFFLLLVGVLYLVPKRIIALLRIVAAFGCVGIFFWSLILWLFFDKSVSMFQYFYTINFLYYLAVDFVFAIDGLSLFFIVLTTFICLLSLLTGWQLRNFKIFLFFLLSIEALLILCFSVLDILVFFICFEAILIPMFVLILIWGSRTRKIKAAYFLFLFTVLGSLFLLFGIFYLYYQAGTTSWLVLQNYGFSPHSQLLLWVCFFIAFIVKIPSFPFFIWLPEAHVEAPTYGSVILAALLLKLGGYGMLRFLLPLFPYANVYFKPVFYVICCLSIFFASFSALRQIDLKRVIAYSSIAHMNFALLGIASLTYVGVQGAIFLMLGHGLVAAALFLLVGVLYDRYHIRAIKYYGGLATTMPLFATVFFFFSLANFSLPGTCNFIGELLVLIGLLQSNVLVCLFATTSIFLSAAFSVWLCNRIIFGVLNERLLSIYSDIVRREFFIFVPLVVGTVGFGLFPQTVLDTLLIFTKLLVI